MNEPTWRQRFVEIERTSDLRLASTHGGRANAFRAVYEAYLASSDWARLRDRVLERDGRRCQGCLAADAAQVHHLTYANVGDEMLFELVSVCDPCHRTLHGRQRGQAAFTARPRPPAWDPSSGEVPPGVLPL